MNNIFQYVLLDKKSARGNIKNESLVYSQAQIDLVYEYTKALERRRLLQLHSPEIHNSQRMITSLAGQINQLENVMKLDDELCRVFRPLQYLDSVAVTFEWYTKDRSNRLLYPRMLRRRLRPCFKELHIYQFYEEHYRTIDDGTELLLKSAYYLKKRISPRFQIDCDLLWDKDEFEFKLVTDYFRVLERLTRRDLKDGAKLSREETACVLTSYCSGTEVMAMGVEVRELNLDIFSYGYTVEKLMGEAFVIGRNPEELVTIFENFDAPQYLTVVTGPHNGHPYNRDVTTVKIENEDSLKVVVDEWFKSGMD